MTAAIAAAIAVGSAAASEPSAEEIQGWSAELRERFYFTPQGSRMMPYDWFLALETLDGSGSFATLDNLARYGFVASGITDSPLNPDDLPVGFARDPEVQPGTGQWVGLTCAACHTGDVEVHGKRIRVDGAPANLDFDRFYADLEAAVTATFFDEERFKRFAARVLGENAADPNAPAQLRLHFAAFQAFLAGDATIRRPALESGFGRVDALTQIINSLSVTDQGDAQNLRRVEAPTSYPHLWLVPQLEYVQWNPIASSPIGRNAGEVLGVFGSAVLRGERENWFKSTALLGQLHAMEHWIAQLEPPKWANVVGSDVDTDLADNGRQLFKEHCKGCHNMPPFEMTDPAENAFGVSFVKIGCVNHRKVATDPVYMRSILARLVRTNEVTALAHEGQAVVPAAGYFLKTVGAVLRRGMTDAGFSREEMAALNGFRFRPASGPASEPQPYAPKSVNCLKAGPLVGTWATGPYFHNGSVPTVYEVLSPPEERRKVFWTGSRELDTERLGFVAENAPGRFRFDTSVAGNGNGGHRFPESGLSHDQRMAIIEYLKVADAPPGLPLPPPPPEDATRTEGGSR